MVRVRRSHPFPKLPRRVRRLNRVIRLVPRRARGTAQKLGRRRPNHRDGRLVVRGSSLPFGRPTDARTTDRQTKRKGRHPPAALNPFSSPKPRVTTRHSRGDSDSSNSHPGVSLHLWSTRSSASRPLDRTTTARRTKTTLDDERRTTKTNAGNPTRPSLPRFALHARPSTRRRRRDPGLLNDDDEASERSLENGTERNATRRPRETSPRSRSRVPNRGSEQEQEQNRTDRSRCRSRPIVPTKRANGRMDGCARARLN